MTIKSWTIIIISLIVVQVIVGQMFDFTIGRSPNVLSDKSISEVEEVLEGSKVDRQFSFLDKLIAGDKTED